MRACSDVRDRARGSAVACPTGLSHLLREAVTMTNRPTTPPLSELPDRMLGPVEIAERLGISDQAVRKMIQRGDLPAYKIARRIRVPESAVLAALTPVISAKDGVR